MRQVHVPPTGDPAALGVTLTLHADTFLYEHHHPTISRSAGDTGHFLTAWVRYDGVDHREIEAQVVSRNGELIGQEVLVSTGDLNVENLEPSVDGDGKRWVAVWRRTEVLPTGKSDVVGRALERNGSELSTAWELSYVEADFDVAEYAPSVAWTGDTALVAFVEGGETDRVYAKVVDPFTCADCNEELLLHETDDHVWSVDVASQWAGGDVPGVADDALILIHDVWTGGPSVNDDDGDVLAQLYDAPPTPVELGGKGVWGGTNVNPCAYAGNGNFRAQLVDSVASSLTFFVASATQTPIACGPATWLPTLSPAVIILRLTDGDGDAQAQLPIPAAAAGQSVTTQWATLTSFGDCALLGGFAPSNALLTTIAW